jgi:hypothetical protein
MLFHGLSEASRARSDAEFVSKLDGLLQEADESQLWLELLRDDCGIQGETLGQLLRETVRISHFSSVVGTGDWSADILVRLCALVNPEAHRRTRMSALRKNVRCAPRNR